MQVPFAHLGDAHIGSLPGGELDGRQMAARRVEVFATFRRSLERIQARHIPLVLIAGDLFEHETAPRNMILEVRDLLAGLAPARIFIAAGNHDWAAADSYYRTLAWPANVHLFLGEWEAVHLPELAVTVHGRGFPAPEVTEHLLQDYQARRGDESDLQLVVLHGEVTSGATGSRYLPLSRADLLGCGADYIALGHIHRPQIVAERGGNVVAAYCGALEPQSFGEEGEHGFYCGWLERGGAVLEFVPVAARSYSSISVDVTGCSTMEDVATRLAAALAGVSAAALVRVSLVGEVEPESHMDLARLMPAGERFYHFQLADCTVPAYDLDELAKGYSARALFVRRMGALGQQAEGREKEVAELALQFGLQALAGREVRVP